MKLVPNEMDLLESKYKVLKIAKKLLVLDVRLFFRINCFLCYTLISVRELIHVIRTITIIYDQRYHFYLRC